MMASRKRMRMVFTEAHLNGVDKVGNETAQSMWLKDSPKGAGPGKFCGTYARRWFLAVGAASANLSKKDDRTSLLADSSTSGYCDFNALRQVLAAAMA